MGRLSRSTRLERKAALKANAPIKKVNTKRRKKRYLLNFGSKAKYIRSLPCCACGRAGPSDPHHHPSRGAGGTSKDLVPLCRACHREFHALGVETFEAKWDIDTKAKAAQYEDWFNTDPQPLGF